MFNNYNYFINFFFLLVFDLGDFSFHLSFFFFFFFCFWFCFVFDLFLFVLLFCLSFNQIPRLTVILQPFWQMFFFNKINFIWIKEFDELHVKHTSFGASKTTILVECRSLWPVLNFAQTANNTASTMFSFVAMNLSLLFRKISL